MDILSALAKLGTLIRVCEATLRLTNEVDDAIVDA